MDIAPTLGVNHVYLVLWWFFYVVSVMFYAFDKYIIDKVRQIVKYYFTMNSQLMVKQETIIYLNCESI